MKTRKNPAFILLGGYLWLDFVNTQAIEHGRIEDRLKSFHDWIAWLLHTRALPAKELQSVVQQVHGARNEAEALSRVLGFRSVLREAAENIVKGSQIPHYVLGEINRQLCLPLGYPQLVWDKGEFHERVIFEVTDVSQLLAPIAQSISDFLCTESLDRLKKCENPECILFFHDVSKNHSRRWCSMTSCGNRQKASAFYHRHRTSGRGRA
jgi:predicted RNA-binding Zn ribbon-like protein